MEEEIKDIINAHDELKCNSKYNFVGLESAFPIKILVKSYVTLSKLKTPRFEHYMELRRKVLSEIDEIRCKHGGSKDENSFEPWFAAYRSTTDVTLPAPGRESVESIRKRDCFLEPEK
ncbi:hypothetical protein C5167_025501 [Papaver somniferum]|uniref:Uncharacterized protein n=1 Tax=Papaver somniferum TaxID=3469 RepID=A0A4Y7JUV9_PAPSO|nr:hypothetical protein C5167_025501 [Papaver somniferum]